MTEQVAGKRRRLGLVAFTIVGLLPLMQPASVMGQARSSDDSLTVVWTRATDGDLRHGALLRVNTSETVGTLVRIDKESRDLLLRPESGKAPIVVKEKDVVLVEKGVDGGKEIIRPEITSMVIFDGPTRSVRYYATRLSPAEKAVLQRLEEAENEVEALQAGMDHAWAIERERLRLLEAVTALHQQYLVERRWTMLDLAERRNVRRDIALVYSQGPDYSYWGGYFHPGRPAEAGKEMAVLAEQLKKARERLREAQAQVVYEQDRVVAVLLTRP